MRLPGGTEESFLWTETQNGAFKTIKEGLLKATALVLLDINKPFQLFIDERSGVAKEFCLNVLNLGSDRWPICPSNWILWPLGGLAAFISLQLQSF